MWILDQFGPKVDDVIAVPFPLYLPESFLTLAAIVFV